MAKNTQKDSSINSVQKIITLGLLAFMGYLFFKQDKQVQQLPPSVESIINKQTPAPQPVKVRIIDTDSGAISFSDLRKGKVLIGKWEVELEPEKALETPKIEAPVITDTKK